jgi:hypothetical protein
MLLSTLGAARKGRPNMRMNRGSTVVLALFLFPPTAAGTAGEAQGELVPLEIQLPRPNPIPTPLNRPPSANRIEPLRAAPRPPLLVPKGLANVALNKPVTGSDSVPIIGELPMVTDGDKDAASGSYVECGPGLQYVQIDLQRNCEIFAIVFWLHHGGQRVCHDVVVQAADDADFISGVRTLFNNDYDNSSGLGLGEDLEYFETHEGKLVSAKGVKARYVRVYTKGNTTDEMNRFTEVEVHGRPVK